jgi:hypothetical protein
LSSLIYSLVSPRESGKLTHVRERRVEQRVGEPARTHDACDPRSGGGDGGGAEVKRRSDDGPEEDLRRRERTG